MSDSLKRIEEDYGTKPKRANADVILKLARALDKSAAVLRETGWRESAEIAERTLNEVAGGSDES